MLTKLFLGYISQTDAPLATRRTGSQTSQTGLLQAPSYFSMTRPRGSGNPLLGSAHQRMPSGTLEEAQDDENNAMKEVRGSLCSRNCFGLVLHVKSGGGGWHLNGAKALPIFGDVQAVKFFRCREEKGCCGWGFEALA